MLRSHVLSLCLIAILVAAVFVAPLLYFGSTFVAIGLSDRLMRRDLPLRVDPVPFESAT